MLCREGSINTCPLPSTTPSFKYVFTTSNRLQPQEGVTIALGFPKGVVTTYTQTEVLGTGFPGIKNSSVVIGFLLVTFAVMLFKYWFKNGRDEKGRGFISPEYEVVDNLSPMEVSGIVYEKIDPKSVSAEIIYFAIKGYIKIRQFETLSTSLFKAASPELSEKDYELTLLKEAYTMPNMYQRKLFESIFSYGIKDKGVTSVYISRLANSFYYTAEKAGDLASDNLLEKGYYKNLGKMKSETMFGNLPHFFTLPFFIFVVYVLGYVFFGQSYLTVYFFVGVLLAYLLYYNLSPAKTKKGVDAKDSLLGLKEYLQIIEGDRIIFHNAPEKKPERFEELLPYAMVFGVEKQWAREFEGIYTSPPNWYTGLGSENFSATIFCHSLLNFNTCTVAALTSVPTGGSGSGGGGGGSFG